MWISHTQKKCFGDVFKSLSGGKKACNMTKQLGVYIDDRGILRCKGRLEHANLSEAARNPILLPKHERFTCLVVEKMHKEQLHSGVSQTLSRVRFRFWIPSGRSVVKWIVRQCRVCRRHEGGAYKTPPMAPLP